MTPPAPDELMKALIEGRRWSAAETQAFFAALVRGELDEISMAAVIAALPPRHVSADELEGAARALLESATPFPQPEYPFADVVGTGGDGLQTLNISTLAALTAAAGGCRIVKHGNRSVSSSSGSFDLLESLGVPFDIPPQQARSQVDRHGITFLFAPNYHAGLRHAAAVRRRLKARTIFHMLGPLVNPARPPRILLGVARPEWAMPMAEVLRRQGIERGLVVHGSGLDEVAIHGPTQLWDVSPRAIVEYELEPGDFGLESFDLNPLVCPDPQESHRRSREVLAGRGRPAENAAVAVNAALVASLFGREDLPRNTRDALESLRSGAVGALAEKLAETAAPSGGAI